MSGTTNGPQPPQNTEESQAQLLEKAKQTVQVEAFYMKRCLDGNKLMDALKHSSNMVSQLRTSLLGPRQYYDLYMFCFDQLKYLEAYLIDEIERGETKMSKLYELVQYAGNILPRLYLLITVGSAYIRSDEAPAKDILYDLVEMCRGIQHPLRGLFLRNYLSEMTKDKLPDRGNHYEGKGGNVSDSIEFVLANFTEMNKLWVRMEPQKGAVLPKEREQRQKERDDLRLLVGKNLARLGQLEGVDGDKYKEVVLPRIGKQIISCKDKMAQQYLMECIVQIFPDEFHLVTLDELMGIFPQLEPTVNIKLILVSLLTRLTNYAQRAQEGSADAAIVPENIFSIIFGHLQTLFSNQPEGSVTTLSDQFEILASLLSLSLKFYPKVLANVDSTLKLSASLLNAGGPRKCKEMSEIQNILKLLRLPLSAFSVVVVLDLQTAPILEFLDLKTRKHVAVDFLKSVVDNETVIAEVETAQKLFEFISPLIHSLGDNNEDDEEDEDFLFEQNLVAASLHLLQGANAAQTFKMCVMSKDILAPQGASHKRYVHTLVPLVFKVLALSPELQRICESEGVEWAKKGKEVFQFVYRIIALLKEHAPSLSLRLFLQSAQSASRVGFGMIANDFLCEALLLFEGLAHSSADQQASLTLIISTLSTISGIDSDKYDSLATKCAHHSARLLKKPDQCRLILRSAHLFTHATSEGDQSDGRFTLDCLQKCLRVADGCMETPLKVQLFVDILNECLYFFVNKSETVTVPFLNSLIDLIQTNVAGDHAALDAATAIYYQNTLKYIQFMQKADKRWVGVEFSNS